MTFLKKTALAASVFFTFTAQAQTSFEEFRQGLLNDFSSFRQNILDDYAKFLDGEWVEYSGFKAVERNAVPKPETIPSVDNQSAQSPQSPQSPQRTPSAPSSPTIPAPALPATPEAFSFDMYGVPMQIPDIDVSIMDKIAGQEDFAEQWRRLDAQQAAKQLVDELKAIADKYNFNDYLTYELVSAYAASRFNGASPMSRTSFVHYAMTHLGFDVRLGLNGSGQALLMLPCKQMVYGRMYLVFDNNKYYIFTDPAVKLNTADTSVFTCQLPESASKAARMDMRLKPLNLPYSPKHYSISHNNIKIEGETNANIYPFIYRYPQIPIADYAESELLPDVRANIVEQLKTQLRDMDSAQAIDSLLAFVQSGFEYATDGQYHGFEKPYFFEEMLFYDKCDCEDRVIFYSYLLWNVLGVENHLIAYPGHESAAVASTPSGKADAYTYDGKTFLISDPTYIGAHSGMCMPNYKTVTPQIDYIYK